MGGGGQGEPQTQQVVGGESTGKKLKTIQIEGVVYDVTNFRHPGGSIIKYLCQDGVDATNAYREFHQRSGKADKYLKSLKVIGPAGKSRFSEKEQARRDALTKDWVLFRQQLEKEGFFKPDPFHIFIRSAELVAMFTLSFYLFAHATNPFILLAAIVIGGIVQGRCGWYMHLAGHYSLTGYIPVDVRLQEFVYGTGCGMSGAWWRNQHNKHHATPQKLKHDVDLDTLPLVAFNAAVLSKVKPGSFMAKWLSMQAYVFAPFSCFLVGMFWTLFLHPRHIIRTKRYFEAFSIMLRYVGWYALMNSFGYDTQSIWGLYLVTFGVGCTYIFLNFAVSHTHLPVSKEDEYLHWVEYSALHTTDVSTDSWFVTWWMSYLNMQIAHHLLPTMPQHYFPKINHRIKALFEKHGLHYDHRTYLGAMRDTFANLNDVGQAAVQGKKEL